MLFAIRCSMSYWMLYLSFQRADQRVSIVARSILVVFAVIGVLSVVLTLAKVIIWLDFLYICSYIKLSITLIKYVPQVSVRERKLARLHSFRGVFWHSFFIDIQAYMNYRRKSTLGWSIGNVLLDFTGGTLSMLQMILNAYNHGNISVWHRMDAFRQWNLTKLTTNFHYTILDDWESIFGDPTKFGLGLFSVMFDILFLLQHYILYRFVFFSLFPQIYLTLSIPYFYSFCIWTFYNLESQKTKN